MLRSPASVMPAFLRLAGLVAAACSALTLTACGGGNRAKDYTPDSIVVLGDENSAFDNTVQTAEGYTIHGLVYTVNMLRTLPDLVTKETFLVCSDLTPTTACTGTIADATTGISNFLPTDPSYPWGQTYRLSLGSSDFNILNFISVGTADKTVASGGTTTTTNVPVKRSFQAVYDCSASLAWMQGLAHSFSKGFRQASNQNEGCFGDLEGAVSYAQAGAKVATLQAQVNSASSRFGSGTLVGIWVGQNDVLEVWGDNATWATQAAKEAELTSRALQLANIVKQVIASGSKVVLVGVPDLGYAPIARVSSITQASECIDRNVLPFCNGDMEKLVVAFNDALMLEGLQDYVYQGRKLAYVDARAQTQSYAGSSGYTNSAVCETATGASKLTMFRPSGQADTSSVKFCTNFSLVSGGNASTYLWADDTHLSWPVHGAIGSAAYNQAANQF